MIEIRSGRLQPEEGTGPRTKSRAYYFDREILKCWVGLTGYRLGYASGDHHVLTIGVDLSADVQDTEDGPGVVVEATLLLRDDNGDDRFSGYADYLLFVELGRRRLDGGDAPEPQPPVGPEQAGGKG